MRTLDQYDVPLQIPKELPEFLDNALLPEEQIVVHWEHSLVLPCNCFFVFAVQLALDALCELHYFFPYLEQFISKGSVFFLEVNEFLVMQVSVVDTGVVGLFYELHDFEAILHCDALLPYASLHLFLHPINLLFFLLDLHCGGLPSVPQPHNHLLFLFPFPLHCLLCPLDTCFQLVQLILHSPKHLVLVLQCPLRLLKQAPILLFFKLHLNEVFFCACPVRGLFLPPRDEFQDTVESDHVVGRPKHLTQIEPPSLQAGASEGSFVGEVVTLLCRLKAGLPTGLEAQNQGNIGAEGLSHLNIALYISVCQCVSMCVSLCRIIHITCMSINVY